MKIQVEKINTFVGHRDAIYTLSKGEKDNCFYSAAGDGFLVKWNISNPEHGELIAKVTNSIYAIEYYPAQNMMLIAENFEGIHQIDLNSKKEISNIKITSAAIFDIKLYNNNAIIACGDGEVLWLDIEKNIILNRIKDSSKSARAIAINPFLKEVCVGFSDHFIRVYDIENGKLKNEWLAHKNSVFTLNFDKEFKNLYSAGRDAQIKTWDCWEQYTLKDSIPAHLYAINHLAFSTSHQLFATASMDKSVKIWNSENNNLLKVLDKSRHAGHGTSANKLLWISENLLLSTGDDKIINLWSIR